MFVKERLFPCIAARFMRTAVVFAGCTNTQPMQPPKPLVAKTTDFGRGVGVSGDVELEPISIFQELATFPLGCGLDIRSRRTDR